MFRGVSQKAEGVIKMKKSMSFLLSALLVLSLAACESNGGARNNDSESSVSSTASSEATWNEITKSDTVTLEF